MAKTGAERMRASRERKRLARLAEQQAAAAKGPHQPALLEGLPAAARPDAGAVGARWRAYTIQHFGSTLVARARMAQWASGMSLAQLAEALGCDTLTAWRELGAALDAVTPFLHARAPVDPGEAPALALQVIIAPRIAAALDAEDAAIGTQVARDGE